MLYSPRRIRGDDRRTTACYSESVNVARVITRGMNVSQRPVPTRPTRESVTTERGAARRAQQGTAARANEPAARPSRRQREIAARARRQQLILIGAVTAVIVAVAVAIAASQHSGSSAGGPAITDGSSGVKPAAMLTVGSKAPDFTLPTVDGKQYHLAQFRGHPVMLEFFAVWCPHCQAMASRLNQLDQDFKGQGLQTLAVLANPYGRNYESSGDTRAVDKADVTWFDTTYKVAHPTLVDKHWTTVNEYGANSYPTLYVLDKNQIVRYATTGEHPYPELADAVTAAAAAK